MLYTVIECVYYVCCMVCMVLVGEWTFHWTVKDWKRFVVAGVVYVAGVACNQIQSDSNIPFFLLFYIGEIVSWTLICEGRLQNRLFKIFVIFFGLGVVEVGFRISLELIVGELLEKETLNLLAVLLTLGMSAIVTRQKWYQNIITYLQVLSRRGSILILCVIICGATIIAFGNMMQGVLDNNKLIMLFRIAIIIELCAVAGIVVWLVLESNQKKYYLEQNALKEEMIRIQQDYYKTIYEKDKEMRSFRHDVASQLGLLKIMLERGEVEKAKEQLESIHQEFEQAFFQKIHVGDEILDAILSMMNQRASQMGIRLEVHGKIESVKQYDTYELCTIFSNAIKNALEACEEMESKGPVLVKILGKSQKLYCIFENGATEEMYNKILKQETTKTDINNHGYGVGNIQRAVKSLGGELEYHYKEGKITLEIFI